MYRTRLTSLSPPRGERGELLTFIGDFPVVVGDTVWTDGKVIYGHFPRYDVPVLSITIGGVPVQPLSVSFESGYFTRAGAWHAATLALPDTRPLFVNDERTFFPVYNDVFQEDQLYDATVYDGKLYTARRRRGGGVGIYLDDEELVDVVESPVAGATLHDLRFADGLAWSAQGSTPVGGVKTNTVVIESAVYHSWLMPGGYSCVEEPHWDADPPYCVGHFTVNMPSWCEEECTVTETTWWDSHFVCTSAGAVHEYSGSTQVSRSGTRVVGEFGTRDVDSGTFGQMGNRCFTGTCDCRSYTHAGGDWAWFGPEPLENIQMVEYVSTQGTERVSESDPSQVRTNFPAARALQNGFRVEHGQEVAEVYDAKDRLMLTYHATQAAPYRTLPDNPFRAAYGFSDGSAVVLGPEYWMFRCTADGEVEYSRQVRNLKFNLMNNVKHAKERRGQG